MKIRCERDDTVLSDDFDSEGKDKRPLGSFGITANATISDSDLDWLRGKCVTFRVCNLPKADRSSAPSRTDGQAEPVTPMGCYTEEQLVNGRDDKWGIGTLSAYEAAAASLTLDLDLYLDVACARDIAYMLDDWRRTEGTILYLAMDIWLDRKFTHATKGSPVKRFVIYGVSCCVHPPGAIGADGCSPRDDAD